MPRDFRPREKKGRQGATAAASPPTGTSARAPRPADDDASEDALLRGVEALGGTKADLALMRDTGSAPKPQVNDAELAQELRAFMQHENMPLAARGGGVEKGGKPGRGGGEARWAGGSEEKKRAAGVKHEAAQGAAAGAPRVADSGARAGAEKHAPVAPVAKGRQNTDRTRARQTPPLRAPHRATDTAAKATHMRFGGGGAPRSQPGSLVLRIEPTPIWTAVELPALGAARAPANVAEESVAKLQALGQETLEEENATYRRLGAGEGGKHVVLGSMSLSDLQFATTLLTSNKAATLSDRISAVTLLLHNSPIHNLKALETLMSMAARPSREESGRATRALADWLASGGGLGVEKLRYFCDQPELPAAAAALQAGASDALRMCTCVWTYEDLLKRTYFAFVQLLERQSHDTLQFVRKQAVTQAFVLLRDKAEQEHNLLRLLTNKLGDPDRSVASKASTHLMDLLHVHPAMKEIVLREVSDVALQSQRAPRGTTQPGSNPHATYYGVLTLNQTLFTARDAPLANEVLAVYFQLFEVCLADAETREKRTAVEKRAGDDSDGAAPPKPAKNRWRDAQRAQRAHGGGAPAENKTAADVDNRLLAAILTGIRRVFPFTTLDADALDKHLDALFRITHTHSFNIAVQALQLVFQVAVGAQRPDAAAVSFSPQVADRYYRTLYDSLLDARLAASSKQAMYLNLLYKSLKADTDVERVKAFVKRLCQVLNLQEPPLICGALVLLSELFRASPGLRTMVTEPEEESVERFHDAPEDEQQQRAVDTRARATLPARDAGYDGRKRDPRYARAGDTALWDVLPLLRHFHPSVCLNAAQLLRGERVTSSADLTLHTLMHFLDRFVFRNPKKHSGLRGNSIMQPALSGDAADSDVLVRRSHVPLAYMNSAAFWNQRADAVPVDQQFFHRFFEAKHKRAKAGEGTQKEAPARDEDASADESGGDELELSTDDEGEREIWKAMKRSLGEEGVGEADEEDDGLLDALAAEGEGEADSDGGGEGEGDSDEGSGGGESDEGSDGGDSDEGSGVDNADEGGEGDHGAPSETDDSEAHSADDDTAMFLEDDDDLVPFTDFAQEEANAVAGKKRGHGETESTSRNRGRAEQRRKRRALPEFASAEDYAHMLASDDEGDT
ncbi:RNA-binding ribosome biosynthesis protein mak21 [Malassezia sp. CBS 17886]|nr:RNA-binding ribosome biosynthesis protein mak21 [Malassezia sp. CBS 17886]